ncbi:MAG: choice-of-anchor tandem repeat GloVer-containing protein [Candidatus Cybelea sp.]
MGSLARFALTICAVALFASCSGSPAPPIGTPNAIPQTSESASSRTDPHRTTTSSYEVVYKFSRSQDGGRPDGSLLAVNGILYGTTRYGGGGACNIYGGTGCGTVYRLDPKSGRKKRLYSFGGGSADGAYPNGSLIDVNGTLYGTTTYGGGGCGSNDGCGTVFSVTTNGTETMLHSFDNKSDGKYPYAGLLDLNGTLYGTTAGGGSCCGTVYSIGTSGSEKVVYNFRGHSDGGYPQAGLTDVKGALYGTTAYGGSSDDGTVYSVTTTGTEKVLHSFSGSPDGATPSSGLVDVRGTLYGTTPSGGNALCYEVSSTCGIVYSITTSGKEKVFYTFSPANDFGGGAAPSAGLVNVNGVLYGTAPVGGNGYGCYDIGCGVVYSLTATAQETVLHVFNGGADGARPDSTMIDVDGTLYGTTPHGGGSNCPKTGSRHSGCGTVFALTP